MQLVTLRDFKQVENRNCRYNLSNEYTSNKELLVKFKSVKLYKLHKLVIPSSFKPVAEADEVIQFRQIAKGKPKKERERERKTR